MKTYTTKLLLLLLPATLLVAGCNRDESPFRGHDNYIAAFTLVQNGVTLKGAVSPGTIVITAPERLSLAGATATVTLSENAAITPDPSAITDWNTAQTFTVTACNGATRTYAYTLERHPVSRSGDVVLLTQADVNEFAAAVKDIDQINGSITIGAATGADTITSLAGLEHLKTVTGDILINPAFKGDLTAFESLEKTGDLQILAKNVKTVRFPKLTALRAGLTVLYAVYGQVARYETIDFPELASVDKGVRISGNIDSLTVINFPKLQQVIEDLIVQGSNASAAKLQAIDLPALQKLGKTLSVSYWQKLERITAPKLETAGGITMSGISVTAIDFSSLKTVKGACSPGFIALSEVSFPALETVTGTLSPPSSDALTALKFPKLEIAGSITIPNAANLTTLQFPALKTVRGELSIQLKSLASLEAFPALDSVGGRLYLYNLPNLTSIALPSLKSAGTISAYDLANVTEIDVRGIKVKHLALYGATQTGLTLTGDDEFPGLLYLGVPQPDATSFPITVQGFKTVGGLTVATSYVTAIDFPWLEHVTGLLYFYYSSLKQIRLPNLQSAGALQVSYCDALETLDLPKLETITGYTSGTLTVGFTCALYSSGITSIALPKLKSITGNLSLTGLTATRKLATISFPELQSLTGTLTITGTNNATFKDLTGFSKLTKAAGVTISNFTQLKNFEPLKGIIPLAAPATWKVSGCAYNPTYRDMLDGRYTN
ncbi:MAG: hypothetical protein LBN98_03745 [Prevotellaceae bacterium]|jgi:hypothetical protein|nr:hypothetical protein [Prevotellaceae bacterium]